MEAGQSSSEPTTRAEEVALEGGNSRTSSFTPTSRTTEKKAEAAAAAAVDHSRHDGPAHGDESFDEKIRLEDERELSIENESSDDYNATLEGTPPDSSSSAAVLEDEASGRTAHVVAEDKTQKNDLPSEGLASDDPPFAVGDHVYRYNSFFSLHQEHGIVLGLYPAKASNDNSNGSERREDDEGTRVEGKGTCSDSNSVDDWVLLIFDFSSWNPKNPSDSGCGGKTISTSSSTASRSCVRVCESSLRRDQWTKVEYGVSPTNDLGSAMYHHLFSRAGSFTTAQSSPAGWVCARVEFLRLHPDVLPPYNSVSSNAECVAVWCKTGTWATLQASSILSLTAVGQVKSTATLAGVVGTAQVTVPAAGMWGWLGYTSQVSLLSLHPVLVPAIAAYGVVTIGAPLAWLWRAKKRWKDLTVQLNERFWQFAVDEPDFFVRHVMAVAGADGRMDAEGTGIGASVRDLSLSKSFDQEWIDAALSEASASSPDPTRGGSPNEQLPAAPRARFRSM